MSYSFVHVPLFILSPRLSLYLIFPFVSFSSSAPLHSPLYQFSCSIFLLFLFSFILFFSLLSYSLVFPLSHFLYLVSFSLFLMNFSSPYLCFLVHASLFLSSSSSFSFYSFPCLVFISASLLSFPYPLFSMFSFFLS